MAVDEFGREIPGARGGGRRSPSPHRHHQHREGSGGGGGSALPTHLNDSLPTSRYEERGVGGGDRDRDHYRDRDRDRGGDDRSSSRKRKTRSRSPPPTSSRRGGDRGSDGGGGNDRSNNYKKSNNKPHPSTVYVEEPMLCQFLWKEANEEKTEEDYDEYRKSYCLNYVRTFFNEHMDDSWFRFMYSPLERYQVAQQEKNRAAEESKEFAQELESSLSKTISSSSTTTNNGSSSSSSDASFCSQISFGRWNSTDWQTRLSSSFFTNKIVATISRESYSGNTCACFDKSSVANTRGSTFCYGRAINCGVDAASFL